MLYRKFKNKITDQSGESLGEVLVALLVSSLALLMLAGVISASGKIMTQSKGKMTDYYKNSNLMVQHNSGSTGTMIATLTEESTSSDINIVPNTSAINVTYYENKSFNNKIVSYCKN